jgi:hypothetical protein
VLAVGLTDTGVGTSLSKAISSPPFTFTKQFSLAIREIVRLLVREDGVGVVTTAGVVTGGAVATGVVRRVFVLVLGELELVLAVVERVLLLVVVGREVVLAGALLPRGTDEAVRAG